jgi:hypothetical protein
VSNDLIAYRLGNSIKMTMSSARAKRLWMEQSKQSFANRCLPMKIANQAGWVILNDKQIRAKWSGGATLQSVIIEQTGSAPHAAISHFGEGVLTFTIPFLFRTPPGIALVFRGPPNEPKDGIYPLEGLVETEWAVARSTANWKFTRPNTWVEFSQGEAICFIVPVALDLMEDLRPSIVDIKSDPETRRQYEIWHRSCREFNERLSRGDPQARMLGWQRYYMHGTAPHASAKPIEQASQHRTRLRLREFAQPTVGDPAEQ